MRSKIKFYKRKIYIIANYYQIQKILTQFRINSED